MSELSSELSSELWGELLETVLGAFVSKPFTHARSMFWYSSDAHTSCKLQCVYWKSTRWKGKCNHNINTIHTMHTMRTMHTYDVSPAMLILTSVSFQMKFWWFPCSWTDVDRFDRVAISVAVWCVPRSLVNFSRNSVNIWSVSGSRSLPFWQAEAKLKLHKNKKKCQEVRKNMPIMPPIGTSSKFWSAYAGETWLPILPHYYRSFAWWPRFVELREKDLSRQWQSTPKKSKVVLSKQKEYRS